MNGINALAFIATRGVEVTLLSETEFYVGGFYKSGGVEVNTDTQQITARYGEVTTIPENSNLLEQLIDLNEIWYERSRERYHGWAEMDEAWVQVKKDYAAMHETNQ
jgi:hypothetical protein